MTDVEAIDPVLTSLSLCFVTDFPEGSLPLLAQAIDGGITCVQLRDKHSTAAIRYQKATFLKDWLGSRHIPLIINDDVNLACAVDAAGLHVGADDMSPELARLKLGPDKILGFSVDSLKALEKANALSCLNYIAASAVFPSQTKLDCTTIWGLQGLHHIVKLSKHPVVAIGGIHAGNVAAVMQQGVIGIAVVSAIANSTHPKQSAAELKRGLYVSDTR